MQKKTKIIIGIVAAVVAVVVLIPGVVFGVEALKTVIRDSAPANYYMDAWGIAFPESAKETYSCKTDGRDWCGYNIYTIEPEDDAAFADYATDPIEPKELEKMTAILDRVQVPEEQRPNLEQVNQWKHFGENESLVSVEDIYMDNLYVLYDRQSYTVYTLISHR
ncbi:MAG: hypothetical protein ACI4LB_09370 [Candidatus Fimenecus sp.]